MTTNKIKRNKLKEAYTTAKGAIILVLVYGFLFIIFGVISLDRIIENGSDQIFALGSVPIPKFLGAGATNLSVFLFSLAGFILIVFAVAVRYFQHKSKLKFMRENGIYDLNKDGKVDSFEDDFLDDF